VAASEDSNTLIDSIVLFKTQIFKKLLNIMKYYNLKIKYDI